MMIQRVPWRAKVHRSQIPQQQVATGRGKLTMGCQGKAKERGGKGVDVHYNTAAVIHEVYCPSAMTQSRSTKQWKRMLASVTGSPKQTSGKKKKGGSIQTNNKLIHTPIHQGTCT